MTTDTHTPVLSSVRETRTAVLQDAEQIIATLMAGLAVMESTAISMDRGTVATAGEDGSELQDTVDRQRAELAETAGHVCPASAGTGFDLPADDGRLDEANRANRELASDLEQAREAVGRLTADVESARAQSRDGDAAVDELQGQVRELKAQLAAAAAAEPVPDTTVEDARADALRIVDALAVDNPELALSEAIELVHIAYAGGKAPEAGPAAATEVQKPLDGIPAPESAANPAEAHTAPPAGGSPAMDDPAPAQEPQPMTAASPFGEEAEEEDGITDESFFDSPPAWDEAAAGVPADGDDEFKFDDAPAPATRIA